MTDDPTPASTNEPATFLRLLPGPEDERDFGGALLSLTGLEIYDRHVVVLWRLRSVDGEQLDLDAISERLHLAEDDQLPSAGRKGLPAVGSFLWWGLRCADDVDTAYQPTSGTLSGGLDELTGQTTVEPGPPSAASLLTISFREALFNFRLQNQ
jgi:hypothetical protein